MNRYSVERLYDPRLYDRRGKRVSRWNVFDTGNFTPEGLEWRAGCLRGWIIGLVLVLAMVVLIGWNQGAS